MTPFYTALTLIGGLLLLLSVTSCLIKSDLYLSKPLIALLLGVLVGPNALGLIRVSNWGDETTVLREAARLTLAVSLMGVALRLPQRYIAQNWRLLGGAARPYNAADVACKQLSGLPYLAAAPAHRPRRRRSPRPTRWSRRL